MVLTGAAAMVIATTMTVPATMATIIPMAAVIAIGAAIVAMAAVITIGAMIIIAAATIITVIATIIWAAVPGAKEPEKRINRDAGRGRIRRIRVIISGIYIRVIDHACRYGHQQQSR
jgi:hypothetical protein